MIQSPPKSVLLAFQASEEAVRLRGGQGNTWRAGANILTLIDELHAGQFILRAVLRRIAEQQEHMTQFGKGFDEAFYDMKAYEKDISLLKGSTLL